jgi:hypothetical protein
MGETMNQDPQVLFQEAWNFAAKRVNAGKHSKDRIRFFLTDGTTKTFDIPPMRDDRMKDEFLEMTLKALINHPIESILLTYEAWFVQPADKGIKVDVDAYLRDNPRPQNNSRRREGVVFYYEASDGTMFTTLAEIATIKKNKRELVRFPEIAPVKEKTRMSHFFEKARDYSKSYRKLFDDIFSEK